MAPRATAKRSGKKAAPSALPISPWSARYSHAVVTPHTSKFRLKWPSISLHDRASPTSRR